MRWCMTRCIRFPMTNRRRGRRGRWARVTVSARTPSLGSGGRASCVRGVWRRSSCRRTRTSRRSWSMSSVCIRTRRSARRCSASTRNRSVELAGITPLGITATNSIDEILALSADCVNYAPLFADIDDIARILRSGKSIVTPVGFTFPVALNDDLAATLGAACRDGGSSLFGGGIHPGFAGDLLPLTVARLCSRIDQITVQEVADLAPHPSSAMNFQ
jgi:hypothetical protein